MKKIITLFATMLLTFCLNAQISIIPKPNKIIVGSENFELNGETLLYSNEKEQHNLNYLHQFLKGGFTFPIEVTSSKPIDNYIILEIDINSNIAKEGYSLMVNKRGVTIRASHEAGLFYGVQSLLQMLPAILYSGKRADNENWIIEGVEIKDSPRFGYRGMHLDVSRTFFDIATVKRFIEWMSFHKLNKFHWHLTDDNGWRVEIKKYPKLTTQGAWRGENEVLEPAFGSGNDRYGGFYTQDEVREVVAFAAKRNIEIIPEIDLPGHSKAVTATYPWVGCDSNDGSLSVQGVAGNVWCVANEENYKMLEDIIEEVAALFPSKYFHIGGDEVNYQAWNNCPKCQKFMKDRGMESHVELLNYFVGRMEKIVEKSGKYMAGWDEILDGGSLNESSLVYAWRSVEKGIEAVKKGHPAVMLPSSYCYFDMKQSPIERGHNWAGIVTLEKSYSLDPLAMAELTQKESELILGVQGALWAELFGYPERFMEYQAYPRVASLSEVGWTEPENKDFNNFKERLHNHHFERLYHMGISFRLDPPEALYQNGAIVVTPPYPWAVVRYTTNEEEPTSQSPIYSKEIVTDKAERYRFATFYKDEIKSVSVQPKNTSYQYLTPSTTIETSMSINSRFPKDNVTDYNYNSYFRTDGKIEAGDYFIYIFDEVVNTSRITVESGIPKISFYGVTDGYVEYSNDGVNYSGKTPFVNHTAVLYPKKGVKSVRIVATKPNDGHILSLQDLKIER